MLDSVSNVATTRTLQRLESEKRSQSIIFLQVSQRVCFEDKVFVKKNTRNRELCFEVAVFVQLRRRCARVRLLSTERGGKSTKYIFGRTKVLKSM